MVDHLVKHFEGTVVRVDGGGFGIVQIEGKLDGAGHAFFTENTLNFNKLNGHLKVGSHVVGVVERTNQSVLPVTKFEVAE